MIQNGAYNNLTIQDKSKSGWILTDGEGTVVLPYEDEQTTEEVGETVFVFVYSNKEGQLVATRKRPYACAGDFAYLRVVGESEFGVFMDIGLDKDVLVPKREQKRPMSKGKSYVVFLYIDKFDGKLCASSYLEDFAEQEVPDLEAGEEVSLLIAERSELGFTAVINNRYLGLLYHNELYEELKIGETCMGYVKKIRDNNKIDLSLRPIGFDFILESREEMLEYLKKIGGVLDLGDKSAPEEIHSRLKMSKKAFKQIIGGLYKQRLITISDHEIRLIEEK